MKIDRRIVAPQNEVRLQTSEVQRTRLPPPTYLPDPTLTRVASSARDTRHSTGCSSFGTSLHELDLLDGARDHRQVMARLETRFAELFSTTGFDNLEELDAAIDALGPEAARLRRMIRDEQVAIASHHRVSSRDSIAARGFLTTHNGGTQRGAPEERIHGEAKRYAMSPERYALLPKRTKPLYGLLRPALDSSIDPVVARPYGEDVYVFDTDAVRDSLTFHLEDSGAVLKWDEGDEPARVWHELFIPWKYRSLMVVPLLHNVVHNNAFHVADFRDHLPERFAALGESGYGVFSYLELQKCGPTSLDDVATFIFHTEPPDGAFLRELQRRAITILDGRDTPSRPTPWLPPAELAEV